MDANIHLLSKQPIVDGMIQKRFWQITLADYMSSSRTHTSLSN